MSLRIYRDKDISLEPLHGRALCVVGYGNQGRAHALNLRDSGFRVEVGQRPGAGFAQATADGFAPQPVSEAVVPADLIILTLPDETAAETYADSVAPVLQPGRALGFVHGFNIRFQFIDPPPGVDVIMVAPKGPGSLLRSLYLENKGLPSLVAVERDASGGALPLALAWAAGIGSARAGVIETTFADETETDLFGEQTILCGGVTSLMKAAFETLVEAGYAPEFAYLECVHELKQVVDLVYAAGMSGMRARVSNTAEYGDLTRGPRMVNQATRQEMRRVLEEIRSGAFAREWIQECRAGRSRMKDLHERDASSEIESAGRAVRQLMPWLTDTS
ncbi:MAG: ketol-acid reductoisomerase [bacterium]|nr:ketol-acid reductoisomerase [bacterium]